MQKTILVTGATDGIGLETAKSLVSQGHNVLLHGRNANKLHDVEQLLSALSTNGQIASFVADFSRLPDVVNLANTIAKSYRHLDVLINNAGVYAASETQTPEGLDIRFVVNTIAPYLLTQRLLPLFNPKGRIVNVSSAAQSPVNLEAMTGPSHLSDKIAYAQSKLALTMWSRSLAETLNDNGPAIIAVNPGSLLGSKMVKDAFGMEGEDLQIGANILSSAALDENFATASGKYFDNDAGTFAPPHPDALDSRKSRDVVLAIESVLDRVLAAE